MHAYYLFISIVVIVMFSRRQHRSPWLRRTGTPTSEAPAACSTA